jgi:MFS family permease
MPESDTPPELPFKFTGGFALPTKTVGLILSFQGVLQMIAQLGLFPMISARLGALKTFRFIIFGYPFLYFLIPYLALLPTALRFPGIFFILVWKVTAQSLSFPSMQMMLAGYAPSKRVLGTINGVAASSASLARALGPTLAGLVQSFGLSLGYSGLSWWFCAVIATAGITISTWMREEESSDCHDQSAKIQDEDEIFTDHLLLAEDDGLAQPSARS